MLPLVAPGKYSVELFVMSNGKLESQGGKQVFNVKPVHATNSNYDEVATFQKKTSDLSRRTSSAGRQLNEATNKLRHIKVALTKTPNASPELFEQIAALNKSLYSLKNTLHGDRVRQSKDVSTSPSIMGRIGGVIWGHWNTTELSTETQKRNIEIAQSGVDQYLLEASIFFDELAAYEQAIEKAGAPYTPGR